MTRDEAMRAAAPGDLHRAAANEECDNPHCRTCAAWRAFWEHERQERRERNRCTTCGALPDDNLWLTVWMWEGRVVCQSCYDAAYQRTQPQRTHGAHEGDNAR